MASLNTLRTKYGIVLSVLIALVLVAFILGDQLSMRGGQQESTDEVVLTVNGEEIRTKEFSEAFQATGNEADAYRYVVYDNFYGPELEKIGLGKLDDEQVKRAMVQLLASGGADKEFVTSVLNGYPPMFFKYLLAQYPASLAMGESFYLNLADLTAFEAQNKLSYDGRFVRYPYSAIEDSEVSVSDDEVRDYYDSHLLRNPNLNVRNIMYVEFPHAVIPQSVEVEAVDMEQTAEATEAAETAEATEVAESEAPAMPTPAPKVETDPNSVTDAVNDFKEAAKGDVESFRDAASEAGYIVNEIGSNMAFQLGSDQLTNWAALSPVGAISNFTVEGKTYVVMVESIDENEYIPFEEREMDIRTKLINDKKYDIIAETMTIGDDAEKFEGVKFTDNSRDMHLVGAICASKEVTGNEVKVKGNDAAYIFVVDKINGELGDVKSQAVSYTERGKIRFMFSFNEAYSNYLGLDDNIRRNICPSQLHPQIIMLISQYVDPLVLEQIRPY